MSSIVISDSVPYNYVMATVLTIDPVTNTLSAVDAAGTSLVTATCAILAGSPVGALAGLQGNLCFDQTNDYIYVCTASGSASAAVWEPISQNIPAATASGQAMQAGQAKGLMIVEDQEATGTGGGTSAAAAIQTRVLNTAVVNTITGASLASNEITLPAGSYRISWSAPAFDLDAHQTGLYNVTSAAYVGVGTSEYSGALAQTRSEGFTHVTLTSAATLALYHYTAQGVVNGLGNATSSGIGHEVYSRVVIEQEPY